MKPTNPLSIAGRVLALVTYTGAVLMTGFPFFDGRWIFAWLVVHIAALFWCVAEVDAGRFPDQPHLGHLAGASWFVVLCAAIERVLA